MQLMVASFNNYQELVDRALMIGEKQQQIENRKRKYGQGKYNSGAQQKPRFTPKSGGNSSIPMEVVAHTTIMVPRMVTGMEEAMARTVPTHQP